MGGKAGKMEGKGRRGWKGRERSKREKREEYLMRMNFWQHGLGCNNIRGGCRDVCVDVLMLVLTLAV